MPHYALPDHYESDTSDPDTTYAWYLRLYLAGELDILNDRDKLPPVANGYVLRLLVGADDGAARTFEVDINWDDDPNLQPEEVLGSALKHMHVRKG